MTHGETNEMLTEDELDPEFPEGDDEGDEDEEDLEGDPEDSEEAEASDPEEPATGGTRPKRRRRNARKERVLHTRVPVVLEEELKRLAGSLRVPVSNVVRAILEDAVNAVDTAAERAEDELLGFADRLAKQRGDLRKKAKAKPAAKSDSAPATKPMECPASSDLLDGAFGYQPLRLAADAECAVCGRTLRAGSDAHRALFDDPGKRAFVGPRCRLLPDGEDR